MLDITARLAQNEVKLKSLQSRLQQMEQEKQQLLQEFLRLDGERRLLIELSKGGNGDAKSL